MIMAVMRLPQAIELRAAPALVLDPSLVLRCPRGRARVVLYAHTIQRCR